MVLNEWITEEYIDKKWVDNAHKEYVKKKPFPHAILVHFLTKEKAVALLEALTKEKFFEKRSDLFEFYQTSDLLHSKDEIIKEFCRFLGSSEFLEYMSSLTGKKVKKISMFGSLYQDTHHLLCHDDQLEDRKIAYVLYLSTLTKDQGGTLQLFTSENHKPVSVGQEIIPSFGTFTFFTVSKKSFHQVSEVIDAQRIALSGWFHG